jgi:hypothetical protein
MGADNDYVCVNLCTACSLVVVQHEPTLPHTDIFGLRNHSTQYTQYCPLHHKNVSRKLSYTLVYETKNNP